MKHLMDQLPFALPVLDLEEKADIISFLRIFGQHASDVMTFVNKGVNFATPRYTAPLLLYHSYGPTSNLYLAAARTTVSNPFRLILTAVGIKLETSI